MKLLILGMLFSVAAHAQIQLPAQCAGENCGKIGGRDHGQFVVRRPDADFMRHFYFPMRKDIIEIARLYNIDPVTLVAAPLAENTLNVTSTVRKLEKMLAGDENQVDENGAPLDPATRMAVYLAKGDTRLSVGPGQIYVYAAKRVEKFAAQIEGRPVRTSGKEIKHALFDMRGSLLYAAAIIRNAQDIYAAGGYDISRRPEILTSLYNLGKVESFLRTTQSEVRYHERTGPAPNYFGYWVGLNYRYIQQQLQLPSVLDQ